MVSTLKTPNQSAAENADGIEILLIEDNPIDAELTISTLKKHNFLNPLQWVKDGQEALDFLFSEGAYANRNVMEPPKLILLDIKLPKVSGIDVLRKIRADAKLRLVPVVIISSSSEHPDLSEAWGLGVNSYIVKSIDLATFTGKVAVVTDRYITPSTDGGPLRSNQRSHPAKDETSPAHLLKQ